MQTKRNDKKLKELLEHSQRVYLATDPASSDLTGKLCNAYTVHWTYDTAALANGTGSAVVKSGGKIWFYSPGGIVDASHVQSISWPVPAFPATVVPVESVTVTVQGRDSLSRARNRTGAPMAPWTNGA